MDEPRKALTARETLDALARGRTVRRWDVHQDALAKLQAAGMVTLQGGQPRRVVLRAWPAALAEICLGDSTAINRAVRVSRAHRGGVKRSRGANGSRRNER